MLTCHRQTADTFDAAATFFDLTREWGTPEPEVLQKIKFAKWNAARILKAIREGKDPNESNPPAPETDLETPMSLGLDPNDLDVQQISGSQKASVVDAPDAGEPPSVPTFEDEPPSVSDPGYFPPQPPSRGDAKAPEPFVPSPMSQSPTPDVGGQFVPPDLPVVSPAPEVSQPATQIPPQPSPHIPTKLPHHIAPSPQPFSDPSAPPSWSTTPSAPHATDAFPPPVVPHASATVQPLSPPAPAPFAAAPVPVSSVNSKSINQAQKHAKWAISALNFEDVPTAVMELRQALAQLGAQ